MGDGRAILVTGRAAAAVIIADKHVWRSIPREMARWLKLFAEEEEEVKSPPDKLLSVVSSVTGSFGALTMAGLFSLSGQRMS